MLRVLYKVEVIEALNIYIQEYSVVVERHR